MTTCRLCGQPLDDPRHPTVLTTDGDRVHITCADRAALMADHTRVVRAMISAVVLTDLLMVAMFSGSSGLVLGLLVVLLIAAHLWINPRWWYLLMVRIRLWYRLRRHL